jgi:hypothetical protein
MTKEGMLAPPSYRAVCEVPALPFEILLVDVAMPSLFFLELGLDCLNKGMLLFQTIDYWITPQHSLQGQVFLYHAIFSEISTRIFSKGTWAACVPFPPIFFFKKWSHLTATLFLLSLVVAKH